MMYTRFLDYVLTSTNQSLPDFLAAACLSFVEFCFHLQQDSNQAFCYVHMYASLDVKHAWKRIVVFFVGVAI